MTAETWPPYRHLMPGDLILVRDDDGRLTEERVKHAPWKLSHGAWVVGICGRAGGYDLARVVAFLGPGRAMSRDDEFVKLAGEYEAAAVLLDAARDDLQRATAKEAEAERAARKLAERLKEFVGRNVTTRNAVVNGRLVRVTWAEDGTAGSVTLEDLTHPTEGGR